MATASFGEELRAHRLRARLTQRELAKRAGVSVRAVRYIEQGRVGQPRRESMRRLADAVGLKIGANSWRSTQADDRLEIRVLGPLEASYGGRVMDVGSSKQRCLLALLALQPNKVVSQEEIIDLLWDRPPDSCQNLVHTYVSRLRKVIGPEPGRLVSAPHGGYRLILDGDQLDLLRFDEFAGSAREAQGRDPHESVRLFDQALAVWRGSLLADLPANLRAHPVAHSITARRFAVALEYADTALGLDLRQERVVEHLRLLTGEEPLHEALHARLMLALAASGQQAAALGLFAEVRGRLDEELGVAPGADITAAHLRILRDDPASAPSSRPTAHSPVPAQLPADVAGFAGRSEYLERLDDLLREDLDGAVVISAIAGTAGVGKTALAVHWAHRVRDHFSDGQLYINLRGYAARAPMRTLEALTRFLHALGVPAERTPIDEDEAGDLYRTMVADRKMLVVLDNAVQAEQVRPLLPGSPGCLVLVTSRDRLTPLVAKEGAHRIVVDVLNPDEARALLVRMIGGERTRAEPDAVAELAKACAHLPLALRIVAANLASLPHTRLRNYTDELQRRGRLSELVVEGDDAGAVRAAFDLSYDALRPEARQAFRLLGLVPGPDFTAEVAAALVGGDVTEARKLLDKLAAAHLVHEHAAGRYLFHDLLREYAADRADSENGNDQMRLATVRLYDYYLSTTAAATGLLYPHVLRIPLDSASAPPQPTAPTTEAAAIDWLDAELPNLVAATTACPAALASYSWRLVDSLRGYFLMRGHGAEGMTMCRVALGAAKQERNIQAEASANDILGLIHYNRSDYAEAVGHNSRALALNRRIGNSVGEATSLHNLGRVYSQLGKPTEASRYYEHALTINRRIGNRHGEATNLNYVGVAWLSRGRPDRAIAHHTQALEISRVIDWPLLDVVAFNGLGLAHWAIGRLDKAVHYHSKSLAASRRIGHQVGEANSLLCLAEANCDAGRYEEAFAQAEGCIIQSRQLGERRHEVGCLDVMATVRERQGYRDVAIGLYTEALHIARKIGFGFGETSVLIGLSDVMRSSGRLTQALAHGENALAVLRGSGMRLLEGRALTALAHTHLDLGDIDQARVHAERALVLVRERSQRLAEARALIVYGLIRHATQDNGDARKLWHAALEIFAAIGAPEAREVADRLDAIGS